MGTISKQPNTPSITAPNVLPDAKNENKNATPKRRRMIRFKRSSPNINLDWGTVKSVQSIKFTKEGIEATCEEGYEFPDAIQSDVKIATNNPQKQSQPSSPVTTSATEGRVPTRPTTQPTRSATQLVIPEKVVMDKIASIDGANGTRAFYKQKMGEAWAKIEENKNSKTPEHRDNCLKYKQYSKLHLLEGEHGTDLKEMLKLMQAIKSLEDASHSLKQTNSNSLGRIKSEFTSECLNERYKHLGNICMIELAIIHKHLMALCSTGTEQPSPINQEHYMNLIDSINKCYEMKCDEIKNNNTEAEKERAVNSIERKKKANKRKGVYCWEDSLDTEPTVSKRAKQASPVVSSISALTSNNTTSATPPAVPKRPETLPQNRIAPAQPNPNNNIITLDITPTPLDSARTERVAPTGSVARLRARFENPQANPQPTATKTVTVNKLPTNLLNNRSMINSTTSRPTIKEGPTTPIVTGNSVSNLTTTIGNQLQTPAKNPVALEEEASAPLIHLGLQRPRRVKNHKSTGIIVTDGETIPRGPLTTAGLFNPTISPAKEDDNTVRKN